jgi:hypothetical protein
MEIELDELQTRVQEGTGIDGETRGRLLFLGFWGYLALIAIFILKILT